MRRVAAHDGMRYLRARRKDGEDGEKEQLDRIKHDIDIERSLLQAEFMRTEELEHELIHRDNLIIV